MATNFDFIKQFIEMSKGNDYINNIPELTRENIAEVGNAIMNYQPSRDAFYNAFMVKITMQIFNSLSANNKFAFLKGRNVVGDIEDSYVDYIKSKNFDPEDDTLLKNVKADIKTIYHKRNRQSLYETSISDPQLRNAFLSDNGLNDLTGRVINTLFESNEWDEFTLIKQLFVDNFKHAGKIVYIGNGTVKEKSDRLLYEIKRYAENIDYVSRDYNELKLANRTSKDNQLLALHKDYKLNIDFQSLANIYNLQKVEIETQTVTVDNFNADEDNIVAVLTDRRAFRIHDTLRTVETFRNGQTLTTKYFFHVWQIISMSYLMNSVYFVEGEEPNTPPETESTDKTNK